MTPSQRDRPPRNPRRLTAGTFLLFLGLYALTQSGRFHVIDEYETFFVAQSLLERGALDVPQVEGSGYFFGKRDSAGRPQAPYGVGQPILTVPFLGAGKPLARLLPRPQPDGDFWLWFFAAGSSAVLAAAAVACFRAWLVRLGVDERRATAAAILLGAATLVWAYATQYRSNIPVMALFLGLALIGERRGAGWSAAKSVLACLAVLVRADAAIGVLLLAVHAAWEPLAATRWRDSLRRLSPHAAGLVAGAAATLLLNWFRFGSPLDGGYPPVDDLGRAAYRFGAPDPVAALSLLFSPGKGLLLLSPVLLLAALALPGLARRRPREAVLAAGMAGLYLVLYSAWQHWEGGWCFGPRFLIPAVPFLLMPLALAPTRRRWIAAAAAAGIVVNVLAVSPNFLAVARGGDYYENLEDPGAPLAYNVLHNPLPAHAVATVAGWRELLDGRVRDGEPGTGLDFWWVFALRESVPLGPVAIILAAQGLLLVSGLWLLWGRGWQRPSRRRRQRLESRQRSAARELARQK